MDKTKWKKLLGKKWAFPAVYLIAASLILALMWWYQDPNEYPLTKDDLGLEEINMQDNVSNNEPLSAEELAEKLGEAISVSKSMEKMQWPVSDLNNMNVSKEFFEKTATDEELEKAIVSFEDQLYPHTGIDIVASDKKGFSVVAALSGEVVRAEKDPVVGYMVELKHENGITTIYQSLSDLKVKKGDTVSQGAILGEANKNMFEKDQAVHLHFEVRKDDLALNPYYFFDQELNQALELQEQENDEQ